MPTPASTWQPNKAAAVQLAAVGLPVGTPDGSIVWAQTSGLDVTGGAGTFTGPAPSFIAPDDVTTVAFDLTVTGTDGATANDSVVVRVFDDVTQTVFVDGELGNDEAGDGTIFAPFRSLRHGIDAADGRDVYLRSVGTYDVSDAAVAIDATTSIHGGYNEAWLRDVAARTAVSVPASGLSYVDAAAVALSALDIVAADAPAGGSSVAVSIDGAGSMTITDSSVTAGAGGAGAPAGAGGNSIGVLADDVGEIDVVRSTITAGAAGTGGAAAGAAGGAGRGAGRWWAGRSGRRGRWGERNERRGGGWQGRGNRRRRPTRCHGGRQRRGRWYRRVESRRSRCWRSRWRRWRGWRRRGRDGRTGR